MRTEISQGGQVVITEEQDLVYREPTRPPARPRLRGAADAGAALPGAAARRPDWPVEVNPVLLFRFSALTYNAHRIHYDRDYARAEGYPGLLVHGPLQALLMAELARPELASRVRLLLPPGRAAVRRAGAHRVRLGGEGRGPRHGPRLSGPHHRDRRHSARLGPDRPRVTASRGPASAALPQPRHRVPRLAHSRTIICAC